MFRISQELIDRNIIPFANGEFDLLIEAYGNVKGPVVLKRALSFNQKRLSKEEKEAVQSLLKVIINPSNTLFSQQPSIFHSNQFARVIFYLQLLNKLQNFYLDLSKDGHYSDDVLSLSWIPVWTKNVAGIIRSKFINDNLSYQINPFYSMFKLILCFFTANVVVDMTKSRETTKDLMFLILFSFMALQIISSEHTQWSNYCSRLKSLKRSDESLYGDTIEYTNNLLTAVETKEFGPDLENINKKEKKVKEVISILFIRNNPALSP